MDFDVASNTSCCATAPRITRLHGQRWSMDACVSSAGLLGAARCAHDGRRACDDGRAGELGRAASACSFSCLGRWGRGAGACEGGTGWCPTSRQARIVKQPPTTSVAAAMGSTANPFAPWQAAMAGGSTASARVPFADCADAIVLPARTQRRRALTLFVIRGQRARRGRRTRCPRLDGHPAGSRPERRRGARHRASRRDRRGRPLLEGFATHGHRGARGGSGPDAWTHFSALTLDYRGPGSSSAVRWPRSRHCGIVPPTCTWRSSKRAA